MTIWGSTKSKKYLTKNYKNISISESILSSNNKKYLSRFIDLQQKNQPDIIEIHNRPNYVDDVKKFQFDKPELTVSIKDDEFEVFLKEIKNL